MARFWKFFLFLLLMTQEAKAEGVNPWLSKRELEELLVERLSGRHRVFFSEQNENGPPVVLPNANGETGVAEFMRSEGRFESMTIRLVGGRMVVWDLSDGDRAIGVMEEVGFRSLYLEIKPEKGVIFRLYAIRPGVFVFEVEHYLDLPPGTERWVVVPGGHKIRGPEK